MNWDIKPRYYDRRGNPLTLLAWGRLLEDRSYKILRQTTLASGIYISTVWLGLDHSCFGDGPMQIFETMVFRPLTEEEIAAKQTSEFRLIRMQTQEEVEMCRYATEEEALAGHAEYVAKWEQFLSWEESLHSS